jgi:hypothetical protein
MSDKIVSQCVQCGKIIIGAETLQKLSLFFDGDIDVTVYGSIAFGVTPKQSDGYDPFFLQIGLDTFKICQYGLFIEFFHD